MLQRATRSETALSCFGVELPGFLMFFLGLGMLLELGSFLEHSHLGSSSKENHFSYFMVLTSDHNKFPIYGESNNANVILIWRDFPLICALFGGI